MVGDSRRGRVVLFGGLGEKTRQGDTWELNGDDWQRVATSGPEPRSLHAMAYDEARGRVVLFGGQNSARQRLGDTWEWDGKEWRRASDAGPSARGAHAMTYHAGRKTVVLFGGYDGTTCGDVWEWDGKAWSPLPPSAAPPRLHSALGYDASRSRLIVFGGFGESNRIGDTWEWDGTTWRSFTVAGPPARAEHEGIYVPGFGFAIFGGIVGQGMAVEDRTRVSDLWLWNGSAWKQAEGLQAVTPQGRLRSSWGMPFGSVR
jgi:hypothetical protein